MSQKQKPSYKEILKKNIALEKENKDLKIFKDIFNSANDGMAITDLDGKFLDVNTKLCHTLGYSREEFLQMSAIDIKPVELHDHFKKQMILLRDQRFISQNTVYVHKNGTLISLETRTSILQFEGNPVIQIIARDITQRKIREEIIQRYEHIFSLTDDLVACVDTNYTYQLVNESYCQDYKLQQDEIIGHPVSEVLGGEIFEETIKPLLDRCLSGETIHYQKWFKHMSTSPKYKDISYHPCQSSTGEIIGALAIIHDLTDLQLAKEARENERERLNNILQAIPDGVYIVDSQHTINYVNPVIEKEFGPVDGRKCFEYLHNHTKPCNDCQKEKVFSGNSVKRQWNSANTNKHYDIFDSPLVNANGIFGKVTFFHDVTHEKKIQTALEKSQTLLNGLISNSPEVIFVKDRKSRYILINDQYDKLFKEKKQVIIGNTDFDIFPEKQAQKHQAEDQEIFNNNIIIRSERHMHLQGEDRVYITTKFPLLDAEGSVYAVAGISTDITKHKKLEHNIQENNKRLTTLINTSLDIIIFKNGEGKWKLANDTALQLFQLTGVDYKGKTDAELAMHSEFYHDAFSAFLKSDEESWKNGKLTKGIEIIPSPDGEDKTFDIVKVPLFHADGTRQGLVIQGHDITNHLKTENRLRQEIIARRKTAEVIQEKSKELEEANIALRVLLKQQKDVEGEIQQSILAQLEKAVIPYLNLLQQSPLDEKGKEYITIISSHVSEVGSSFIKKLSNPALKLTKKELLVADLVKNGKSTKEIAVLLTLQPPSVETYRNNIRKKLNINNKKISLYQYLSITFSP